MNPLALVCRMKAVLSDAFCPKRMHSPMVRLEVPYFSQFMSAKLVEEYIDDRLTPNTDPKWRESGADNAGEYERWTWNDCGMACFKMILVALRKVPASTGIVALAKEAEKYGVYKLEGKSISPLHYTEFCIFAEKAYGLNARSVSALSVCRTKAELERQNFVIASVHPNIRYTDSVPPKRGGHLVLVVGYDDERGGLFIHNPSGFQSNNSQERAFVPYADFKRFFAYRGIVIKHDL